MLKKIYAVIVTYNRSELLERCLVSLSKQIYEIEKVIVIDNCSTDNTSEVVKLWMESKNGWIVYKKMSTNCGGAGGFYEGFRYSIKMKPDWIVVMDDDAAPREDYLQKIMLYAEKYPQIGCLIGSEYVGDTTQRAYGGRRRIADKHTLREKIVKEEEYREPYFYIDSLTFVGPVIRGDIIEKTGLPDKDFFIYYDDTDYSFRMRKYTKIMCVPSAIIKHRTDFEKDVMQEGQKEWRRYYMYRNKLVVKKRFITNPFYKLRGIISMYYQEVRDLLNLLRKQQKTSDETWRSIWIVTRATHDAIRNKLGRKDYINYDK